jgi:hypothetical protein
MFEQRPYRRKWLIFVGERGESPRQVWNSADPSFIPSHRAGDHLNFTGSLRRSTRPSRTGPGGFTRRTSNVASRKTKETTMKTILAISLALVSALTAVAAAQPAEPTGCATPTPCATPYAAPSVAPVAPPVAAPQPALGFAEPTATAPSALPSLTAETDERPEGWHKPVGRRFLHGFRLGWTYISHYDRPTREGGKSLKEEFGLKTPNMMLLGYEGFYRIVGHSWLNVLMVGNVTVAGLEQSKFIPAASGLIGFEFDRSFQIGVGVNLTPDPQAPSHMIVAAGWTPMVGSIQTPIHVFYVPDPDSNNRMGATVGMTW